MKKTLLLILINTFFSLVSSSLFADSWGTTTTLNPYAYDLNSTWDESTQKLTLSFKLNAPAVTSTAYNDNIGIQILAVGENGAKYFMYAVPTTACQSAGLKTFEIDLSDGKGNTDVELPTNETLTWEVIVRGNNKTLTAPQQLLITKDGSQTGKIKNWRFPTSIAVNNDFNSADFGSIYVAGNAYYNGTTEFQGLTKYDPIFTNMGWYGIYNGNNNMPRRVRVSEDGRIFASSYTTSSPTVWEVSSDLNGWTTRISEASINIGMDLKGSGNNLKVLLYSYKSSDYICNEYTWNGSSFSSGEEVRAIDDGTYAVVSDHHANIRYDNYYNGYWFAGSRSGSSEKQLAHIVAEGDACDVYYTSSDLWGGSGVLSYDSMLVRGHNNDHTTNNPSKLIFYTVSKAANGKVQLDVAYGGAKSVHSACKGRYVNDFAIDRAYNLYVVSTQNSEVSKGDYSTLSQTGQLMAFALPYSGATTTPAPKVDAYTFRLDRQQLNPFAYNLYTTQEGDGRIALHFFLNANADQVLIRLIDEKGKKYPLRNYPPKGSDKNYVQYNDDGFKTIIKKEDIDSLNLPLNGTYSWEVEVVNNSVQQP